MTSPGGSDGQTGGWVGETGWVKWAAPPIKARGKRDITGHQPGEATKVNAGDGASVGQVARK